MSNESTAILAIDKERQKNLIATVQNARSRNISSVPPRNDGSKRPLPGEWKTYQTRHPTGSELNDWYGKNKATGVGYVCGAVSDNLEAMDFDVREIYARYRVAAGKAGLLEVLARIEDGYLEHSPNGAHLLYQCSEIGRSMKLATRPKSAEEKKHENDNTETLIETRGEGGYIIAAPSYGAVHPDGEYTQVSGDVTTIVEITPEERDDLLALARTFHIAPEEKVTAESDRASRDTKGVGRPGDDFNIRADWFEDVLVGWTEAYREGEKIFVRKPGKVTGVSGTINSDGTDRFYCFSTATEFEQKCYDKFAAHAVLHHGGDYSAAAKDLVTKGYGGKSSTASNQIVSMSDLVWGQPVLFGELNTPEIPSTLFPGIYGKFVESVSMATQTPSGLAAMLMLSAMATCLQGKFGVSAFPGYTEPTQIWTVTSLPPASRKTAVMQHIIAPITMWEAERYAEQEIQIKETRTQRDVVERRIERLKQKAGNAEDLDKRNEMMIEIDQLSVDMPQELRSPRVYSGDTNSEGLQKLLVENNGRMSILTDEGGIFEVMAGMYSNGKVNINVFLQGHAGSSIRVDRAGRTVTIDEPSLTFGMAVQPDVIKNLSKNSKGSFRGNGCLARFLFCIPESNIGKRNVRIRAVVDSSLKNEYTRSIKSLLDLPDLTAPDGSKLTLGLDSDALNEWEDFAQRIENEQGPAGSLESIQDWSGKLPGATLRIAGLFHVAEFGVGKTSISLSTIRNAISLAEILIDHARAAFDMMGADPVVEDAKYVYERVLAFRAESFNRNQLHRQLRGRFTKVDRLIDALAVLTEMHIISEPVSKSSGRRPEIIHFVNPKVWEVIAS